ncbi:MAG: hypothetical protein ASARMPRED_002243 [Alectoria sarmentosa]|nr:MAG: hypothetical protein ASARMPRED_002243 [Alectoria sarmentosa]
MNFIPRQHLRISAFFILRIPSLPKFKTSGDASIPHLSVLTPNNTSQELPLLRAAMEGKSPSGLSICRQLCPALPGPCGFSKADPHDQSCPLAIPQSPGLRPWPGQSGTLPLQQNDENKNLDIGFHDSMREFNPSSNRTKSLSGMKPE